MSTSPAAIHNLARRLLAGDSARAESSQGEANQTVRVCDKFRLPLTKLAGTAGFASLLKRALAVAKRQDPSLDRLEVEADGSLALPDNGLLREWSAAKTAPQGGAILVAELLNLLVTLIGESLTLSMVREAFPDVSIETLTLRTEEKP